MIKEIAFIGYPVSDITRSRRFYEDVFGLKVTSAPEGVEWVEFDIGPTTFAIGHFENWNIAQGGPMLGLEVNDFDKAIATLKEKGVEFCTEPFESPVCRMAIVKDPDHNALMIHKRKE